MPTVAFITLGCKVNQYETAAMTGLFIERGYDTVSPEELADVYVINTCSVTALSEKKSRQLIRRCKRQNPCAIIAVAGCYAQIGDERELAQLGVNLILGNRERGKVAELVEKLRQDKPKTPLLSRPDIMTAESYEDLGLTAMPGRTRAFLKIEDGCENFCSYCVIPYTRGPVRSRSLQSIKEEAAKLAAAGFKEIVLTGIHLGAYGRDLDPNVNLAAAVKAALSLPEVRRLRLGSLESIELSEELLRLMEEDPRICRHLHLPLQAGANEILRSMNRHYLAADFVGLVKKIRSRLPDVAISSDIIVGFPGETEELFQESLALVEELKFSRLHVFPYSPRPGTQAADFPGQVSAAAKKDRLQRMQLAASDSSREFAQKFLGRTAKVLFESVEDDLAEGLTGEYLRVYTNSPVTPGEIAAVRLVGLCKDGLRGEICR